VTERLDDVAFERHFTIRELSDLWHLAYETVQRLVENEPGVLIFHTDGTLKKRKYTTIRVPESVALRVHRSMRPK